MDTPLILTLMQAVCLIDTLRRANAEVIVASVEKTKTVTCSRKTRIETDALLSDVKDESFDLIALPGGMPGKLLYFVFFYEQAKPQLRLISAGRS